MPLDLLYEDNELAVFNKPSGVPATRHLGQESGTAVHFALQTHPQLPFPDSLERGLLHRLDTGTSGALAFAKTEASYLHFRKIWNQSVRKIYRAQSRGALHELPPLPHEILLELGHDAKSSKKMRVIDPKLNVSISEQLRRIRGKPQPAKTLLVQASSLPDSRIDLEIQIKTGVLHQIRAHLAYLGLPLLGDTLYRGEESSRLWLHAWRLEIEGRVIEAPLPSDWLTQSS